MTKPTTTPTTTTTKATTTTTKAMITSTVTTTKKFTTTKRTTSNAMTTARKSLCCEVDCVAFAPVLFSLFHVRLFSRWDVLSLAVFHVVFDACFLLCVNFSVHTAADHISHVSSFQSVDINTPTINENVVGIYKAFGLKNSCIALRGLCEIATIRSDCASECAVWDAKDGPCASVTKEEATKQLCSVFDPTDYWLKMGFNALPAKTCKVLKQCNLAMAGGSRCQSECAALAQECRDRDVVLKAECATTTTTTTLKTTKGT